jgi:hypothetical protein
LIVRSKEGIFHMTPKETDLLKAAVEGRNSNQGYVLGSKTAYKSLASQTPPLVEFNDEIKSQDGKQVAVRASDAGVTKLGEIAPSNAAPSTAGTPRFEIDDYTPPEGKRGRRAGGEAKYPFDKLAVGQSFHVPATEANKNPAKGLASTVSSANRRYAEKIDGTHKNRKGEDVPNYKLTRKFSVSPAAADDPRGPGARVVRRA